MLIVTSAAFSAESFRDCSRGSFWFRCLIFFTQKLLISGLLSWSFGGVGYAQSELPVLVKAPANAKVMLVVDDSGSMNAVMEHPDFDPTASCPADPARQVPSVVYRLLSGSAAPALSQQLLPVLIELNGGYVSGSTTGSLYASTLFSAAASAPLVNGLTCNNTANSKVCCPGTSGASCPKTGVSTAALFGTPSVTGASIFALNRLARVNTQYVTDSLGHEYLYLSYRRNESMSQTENWNDIWARFDAAGNPQGTYTAVYSTKGGTVVFNGRQVFLSQGFYRREYLRWIFYCATPAQISSLPGLTRLQAVQQVATNLINSNPNVSFGLGTLNGSTYSAGAHSGSLHMQWLTPQGNVTTCATGQVRMPIGTARASLIAGLQTITARGGTPLTATYTETLRYFGGAQDTDPCSASTASYTSPITSQCDAHSIILLTDGLPTAEDSRRLPNGSFISNLDGVSNPTSSNGACSSSDCRATFLPDASWYAYHTDLRAGISGTQNIVSYAVAFGVPRYPLLDRFAQTGGSGTSYSATTSAQLSSVLDDIVNSIFSTPTSGAGVATLEKIFGETKVYQPVFYADSWVSRIQVYRYESGVDGLEYEFDISEVLEARNPATDPRTILTGSDPDNDGRTSLAVSFSTENAELLRPQLFRLFETGALTPTLLASPLAAFTTTAAAQTLIRYLHGEQIEGTRSRDRDADGLTDKLGDIVFSRPVEVGPKNGAYNSMTGYSEFLRRQQSEPRILLVGANDGMLHAFDSATGRELWAYIPSSQLKYLERLARSNYNTQARRAFVDGLISVEDVFRNGEWRTLAMFGLRTGGSTYTVLDITDRDSPNLVWEVADPATLGESWSKPTVVLSGDSGVDPSRYLWHMVVGTGEGKSTPGVNVGLYDLSSSVPPQLQVIPISPTDPIGSRASGIATSQNDRDRSVDRLYVGTEQGDLFRVNISGAPASWQVQRLFDGDATRPIVASPIVVLAQNPRFPQSSPERLAVGVYFGTGRHDQTSDIAVIGAVSQSIVGVFDPVNTSDDTFQNVLVNQTRSHLQNQSVSSFAIRKDSTTGAYLIPSGKSGFYIDLATTISVSSGNFINPVGQVVASPINLRGQLLFSTFLPDSGTCDIGGYGFLQGVNFNTGGGSVVDSVFDPRRPFYNGGIPDANRDGSFTAADASLLVESSRIEPVLDAAVVSVDLNDVVSPYRHDGKLLSDDIRVHISGGILPSVSSIGHTGLPSSPVLLTGKGQVLVQAAYPSDPGGTTPGTSDGNSGGGANPIEGGPIEPGQGAPGPDIGSTGQIPPPKALPINVYNLPMDVLSFHEVINE